MKSYKYVIGVAACILAMFALAMCYPAAAQPTNLTAETLYETGVMNADASVISGNLLPTNAPAVTLPPGVDQLVNLVFPSPAAKAKVMQVLLWLAVWGVAIGAFSQWIRRKLFDIMNRAAETAEGDDDVWLARVFANPGYKLLSLLLKYVHIYLPTTADLERAIALQKEAVKKAAEGE